MRWGGFRVFGGGVVGCWEFLRVGMVVGGVGGVLVEGGVRGIWWKGGVGYVCGGK